MDATKYIIFSVLIYTVTAEHSGAYSSPQYAKKMYPRVDMNSLLPREKPPIPFKRRIEAASIDRYDNSTDNDLRKTDEYGRDNGDYGRNEQGSSFLDTAGSFLSGAGGQMVSSLANDFIARSTGSSQVLSLNLTNLVILIVLKALILAAGFFGAGAWKGGHHYGRSLEDNKNATYISEDEIMLYLSYLSGQQTRDYSCMYQLSCKRPQQAALYSSGAELLLQGAKLMQGNSVELEEYEVISNGIKDAAKWGEEGNPCDTRYKCGE